MSAAIPKTPPKGSNPGDVPPSSDSKLKRAADGLSSAASSIASWGPV